MKNQHGSKSPIILFDSSSSVDDLRRFNLNDVFIITFDYESHKTLLENKIDHEISDSYLDDDSLQTIRQNSYKLAKWYEDPIIINSITHEGINLGELFYVEFHYFLVPFLKKFVEVSNIIKKFNGSKFASSSVLYEIIKSFTPYVQKLNDDEPYGEFLYDSVKVDLKILNKSLEFDMPFAYYQKLKNLSEKIVHALFGPKSSYGNSVLFIEFDTVRFKKIFSILPKFATNTVFYGRRRPAIWNLESFLIIKRSGCKVATYYDLMNKNIKKTIKDNSDVILHDIDSLWEKEEFLKSFFSIGNFSFWNAMKPSFLQLCKKYIPKGIEEIELAKKLFEKYEFKLILVWSESGFNEQIVISLAKKFNIPIMLLQHGLYIDTPDSYEFNKFWGILPIRSDKFAVWGELSKQYAITCNIPSDKIETFGSLLHDDFFTSSIINLNTDFILLATSGPNNNFVNDLTVDTNKNYEMNIKKICEIVTKLNKKLVIKLHPFQAELDVTKIAKEVNPEITVIKSGDILPLIKYCEAVIVIDISTVILESQILQKPVVSVLTKDSGFTGLSIFKLNPSIESNIDELESVLDKIFSNDDFKKQLVLTGIQYVNNYFSNQGMASEKLLSFLEKLK